MLKARRIERSEKSTILHHLSCSVSEVPLKYWRLYNINTGQKTLWVLEGTRVKILLSTQEGGPSLAELGSRVPRVLTSEAGPLSAPGQEKVTNSWQRLWTTKQHTVQREQTEQRVELQPCTPSDSGSFVRFHWLFFCVCVCVCLLLI